MARPRRIMLVILVLLAIVLPVLVPSAAQGHEPTAHWIQLTRTAYDVTYFDTFTGHCCFKMQIVSTWRTVDNWCGTLVSMRFYYYDIQPGTRVYGGRIEIFDNKGGVITRDADFYWDATYPFEGYSTPPIPIDTPFCGGGANGYLHVLFIKHNIDPANPDNWWHNSRAMMYTIR